MKYYIVIIAFILNLGQVFAQNGRLRIVSSTYSNVVNKNSISSINPVYEHNGNTLSSDSGIVYEDEIRRQFFEAFGNIVITQPSGTVIYADQLHYDASAQLAKLSGNVKLVDKSSVLTTNYLTYNMRSKVGTYTGGGRIISQKDTITSQNAYYFENTGDAYFRFKVVVRNPQVKVFTDTMRYNNISKNTYFFGPTDIKGNNQENLYTESGVYNTSTGIADFNKNNLYSEGSRFLKGDSLHYERSLGIGKAFRNVVFVDTLDKFYGYGGKGEYIQADESIELTVKPYIVTVVKEDADSTQRDSSAAQASADTTKQVKNNKKLDSRTIHQPTDSLQKDSTLSTSDQQLEAKMDSIYMTADTLYSRVILAKDYKPLDLKLDRNGGELIDETDIDYGDQELDLSTETDSTQATLVDSTSINTIENIKTDTLKKPVESLTPKANIKPKNPSSAPVDTSSSRAYIKNTLKADSILRKETVISPQGHADSVISNALKTAQRPDTIKTTDSLQQQQVTDTARTRIVKAYYNVRMFKSDLQAVADSMYYGMQDSMFRFMGRPMIWAEGSQISADTIYMQIINQRMDNALLKENAFMVNAVSDSSKFNQLKGRKITTFFANNAIEKIFVDGNAENLIFSVNDKTNVITEMFHDRGGRIKVIMENKKIKDYITIRKIDQKLYPFSQVTPEQEMLPGFIWRPQDRPKSKEDLLNRKRELPKELVATEQNDSETMSGKAIERKQEIEENFEEEQ